LYIIVSHLVAPVALPVAQPVETACIILVLNTKYHTIRCLKI